MPYITKERVAEVREQLKKEFPTKKGWKLSVIRDGHSTIRVTVMQAPFDLIPDMADKRKCTVNTFYIEDHYKACPEAVRVLKRINEIADAGNEITSHDSDYGAVSRFYVDIQIGEWDKPFKVAERELA